MPFGDEVRSEDRPIIIYFNVSCGKYDYKEKVGSNYEPRTCTYVQAAYKRHFIEWDKGNGAEAKPHWRLVIVLEDRTADKVFEYHVQTHFPSTYARMFATFVPHLNRGEVIRIKTWAGSENPKVSLCYIVSPTDGLEEDRYPGHTRSEKITNDDYAKKVIESSPYYEDNDGKGAGAESAPEIAEGTPAVAPTLASKATVAVFGYIGTLPADYRFTQPAGEEEIAECRHALTSSLFFDYTHFDLLLYTVHKGANLDPGAKCVEGPSSGDVRLLTRVLLRGDLRMLRNAMEGNRREFGVQSGTWEPEPNEYDPFIDE